MSKLADYSQIVTGDQLDAALRAGGFDGVFHYLGDDFALREEDPLIVADIRAKGWAQAGIFVPTLGAVNGSGDAQRQLSTYSYPRGSVAVLDIEPDEFRANPGGWAAAADGWCDEIRAAGLSPWVYGTDATVAACGNHADAIWRAVPGECDPAGPGLADAFFAGRRAIQCLSGVWGGVEFDVSYSQLTIGMARSAGGDGMGIAVRPDGSGQIDWLEVTGSDRHVEHRVLTPGQPASAAPVDSIGGANFVPNSVRAWWNATTTVLTVMAQVADGSWWAIGWNGAWGTWLPTDISTALPPPGPQGPPGPNTDEVLRTYLRGAPA